MFGGLSAEMGGIVDHYCLNCLFIKCLFMTTLVEIGTVDLKEKML